MLRQSRQRSARRRVPQQIDLFAENAPTIGGMPAWFGLPMETQAALNTRLGRQPGIDLIYEPTTDERGPSLDFLEHDCTSIQQSPALALPSG